MRHAWKALNRPQRAAFLPAAMALIAGITAIVIVLVSAWGPEARTAVLGDRAAA